MDREETKQKLKSFLVQYLINHKNIDCRDYFKCLNPNHQNASRSMRYNPKDNTVHCFSCGCTYDIFSLIGMDFNLPHFQDQLDKASELFLNSKNINEPKITRSKIIQVAETKTKIVDYTSFFRICAKQTANTDFFQESGISDETIIKFNLGFDPEFSIGNKQQIKAFIIPNGPYGFWAVNTETDLDDKNYIFYYGKDVLFTANYNDSTENIFITDNVIDSIYMAQMGVCSIVVSNEIHLNELVYFLSQQVNKHTYFISIKDNSRLVNYILSELKNFEQQCHLIDLAYPCTGIKDLIVSSPDKFKYRINNIKKLLTITPKKLLAKKQYDTITDENSFMEMYYAKGVFSITTDVITKRKLLSSWIIDSPEDSNFIYLTSIAEWNVISVELDTLTTDIQKSYYSLLPKIGLSENTGNAETDAANLLQIFASRKIKKQDNSVIIINLQNCTDDYIRTLSNKIMQELKNYNHNIIFFGLPNNRSLLEEYGWQVFDIKTDSQENDETYVNSYTVTTNCVSTGKLEFYITLE